MGNEHGKASASATPAGIHSMDESLQKKFAKGIQFNMKIVLKGDRNTGKTCLYNRMAGKGFQEAYLPTNEIQVTSILWSYKVTSDTVKVEVWDVVDKGRVQKPQTKGGLKIFNTTALEEEEEEGEGGEGGKVLDATFLNVYKACHGVVLIFDMTKIWTWKYVERELPNIPYDIPVIVLANFRDLGDHRVITREDVMALTESARPDGCSEIMYAESSMKNAFGLMHLHKFLSIPFLQLQQDMLLQQIQVSREQMLAARDELTMASTTEDQNYDVFVARLQRAAEERKRKILQQQEAPESTDSVGGSSRHHTADSERASTRSSSSASSTAHPPSQTTPTAGVAAVRRRDSGSGKKGSKMSRLSNLLSSKNKDKTSESSPGPIPVSPRGTNRATADIEEFVPEGDVDSFLDDDDTGGGGDVVDGGGSEDSEEESSDEETHPAVAKDEDLSSVEEEDTPPSPPKQSSQKPSPVATLEPSPVATLEPSPVATLEPSPVATRDKPTRPPVQLKSAKEVQLTESEEEEEEEEEQQRVPHSATNRQKDLELFWGTEEKGVKGGGGGGEGSDGKPKGKAKSTGLLLNWTVPEPAEPTKPAKKSPDVSEERRERRKKKSRKGSGSKRREAEVINGVTTPSGTDSVSALDAWLNSGDASLQPTAASRGWRDKVGEEAGGKGEEGSQGRSKKHRERGASDGGGARRKKKHKLRHSTKEGEDTH